MAGLRGMSVDRVLGLAGNGAAAAADGEAPAEAPTEEAPAAEEATEAAE